MRRLLKFLLCWSPSLHVPHFFDWHTYVKRPNLQWRPTHKSLWHLSIGAAAVSAVLVLLLLWSGIHAQPTAINSPDAQLGAEEDLGPELPDDPFAQKARTAAEDDPFAANSNPGNSDDEMFATLKPRANAAAEALDSDFAPPIKVSQEEFGGKPGLTFNEPEIVMEAQPTGETAEPEPDLLLPVEEEPKIALDTKPTETPAEPELELVEPKIAMEASKDEPAEPDITADLEPIMPEPEPRIVLNEKSDELPAEPEEDPAPAPKTVEVALAPMPEIGKSEPVDEEPPAPPFKVVQVAQANRPNPFSDDDDGPPRKPSSAAKPIQKPQTPPRSNPMDDEAFDDTPPKKAAAPSAAPNRPRPNFGDDEENDPMSKPMPTATKAPAPIPKPIDLPPAQPPVNKPMGNNPMGDDDGFPISRPATSTGATAKQNSNVKIRDLDDEQPATPTPKIAPVTPKAAPNRPNPFGDEEPMGQPRSANQVNAPAKPVVQSQEFPDPAHPPMPQPPPNAPMPQQQKPRPSSQVYDEAVTPQDAQMKAKPDLRIEILSAPEAAVGGPVVLSFRIANVGRIPATGVLAIDVLPPELRHPSSQRLEYRIGRLNPGESRSTQLRLTAAQAGLTINRASVSSDEGGFAEGSVRINVLERGNRPNYQPSNPPGNCEPVPYQYMLTPQPDCCVPY